MASRILHTVVPGYADAAHAYALEELLSGGPPPRQVTSAGRAALIVRRLARSAADDRPVPGAPFPSGEVVAFAADSRPACCVRDGAPVTFARPDARMLRRISPEARTALGRYTSFLAAPMITRGTAVGVLILARGPSTPPFRDDDAQAANDLAARAGAAIADSLALSRHQSVAEALRPPRPTVASLSPDRLEVAGRCLPAAGCDVGGDWYDIFPLPRQRTGLIIGDVMGHGTHAATVMTRLSTAACTLAYLDLPPAEVLHQLNRTALASRQDTLLTCAYAVIDPASQSCTIAAAGHLPPILAMPDGTTRVPGMPGGQTIGVAPTSYGQARIRLRPGTILALYTDGLAETRTRPFDQGILALQSALARQHPDLDAACEELITSLGASREDDITIVLARIPPGPAT
jgi:GAF domain-containing protein